MMKNFVSLFLNALRGYGVDALNNNVICDFDDEVYPTGTGGVVVCKEKLELAGISYNHVLLITFTHYKEPYDVAQVYYVRGWGHCWLRA